MTVLVVTGTDTGIGKTVFSAGLAGALGAHYWKPIQAGVDPEGDKESVAALSGLPASHILPEAYRLATPASPHLAAPLRPLGAPSSRPSPVSGSDSARPDGMEWSPPWTATEDDQLREAMQLGRIDIYDGEELHFDVPGLAGWREGMEGFADQPNTAVKISGIGLPGIRWTAENNAEVVLEGYVDPNETHIEGPFGEWTGYYASGEHPEPVLEVEAIYHRNDPIILGVPPMGQGSDEMARYRAVLRSAMLKQNLAEAGVPDVTGVWCHEIGASRLLHGVSIKQRYPGHSKQAGHIAAQCQAANYANRFIIVVDDDIDVTNLEQLIWAMCTRCDPATTRD